MTLSSNALIWSMAEPSLLNFPVMLIRPLLLLLMGASWALSPAKNLVISTTSAELSRL